jgi:hypothetical protein
MIRKTAPLSAGPRRLDKRERLQGKLVVLGGGGFHTSLLPVVVLT